VSSKDAWQTFEAHAPQYTALRQRLVPGYEKFYGTAVGALRLRAEGEPERILDLGAGTGLMTAHVAAAFPAARFELLDAAPSMLDEAVETLGEFVSAVHVQDMGARLPDGPFDAVVSALAIHHLEDAGKRALYGRVHAALRPGGMFVNAEQVAGPTDALTALYDDRWAQDCRALGASEAEIAAALRRREHDRCASVEEQLQWLREAGFAWADCYYKDWGLAVLVAAKEG
jgi:tRNA (cmo5U34)-methyltransferase